MKGLLLSKLDDLPKTQSGVVTKFGEVSVKPQLVPASTGREVRQALEQRNKARYDYHADITERDVEKTMSLVSELVSRLTAEVE
ncbi:MAG: hypothetical protein HY347_02345 [candidate division NC10 bacterium]|nr:hypothetical protein [candidate division NC10 bacterium]